MKDSKQNFFSADWPAPGHIKTCITTRQNGYSIKPFNSFNLATHVDDDPEHVKANRRKLLEVLPSTPHWLDQQHTNTCIQINPQTDRTPLADAAYTSEGNIVCCVLTADCLPLLITNEQGTLVSSIHAGWRGLANGIIETSINKIKISSQEDERNFLVWLGPAISQQNFEVGIEVKDIFIQKYPGCEAAFIASKKTTKYYFNIYQMAKFILNELGINKIYGGNFCTYEEKERFFSYRRDGQTGRIASMIWIEK